MQPEERKQSMPEDNDFQVLDIDDIEEVEFSSDDNLESLEPKKGKEKSHLARKNIEEILAERELQRQLSDVFDEDILPD